MPPSTIVCSAALAIMGDGMATKRQKMERAIVVRVSRHLDRREPGRCAYQYWSGACEQCARHSFGACYECQIIQLELERVFPRPVVGGSDE